MSKLLEDIKKLRALTGAGLSDVKKAIEEAAGASRRLSNSSVSVVRLSLLSVATTKPKKAASSLLTKATMLSW